MFGILLGRNVQLVMQTLNIEFIYDGNDKAEDVAF